MYPLIVRCGNCDNSASTQTNTHDSQSQSPSRFIRARRLIHHRNAALAARNRGAADRRPPPTHPYSPGTRARSPDSFVKTLSTHNTRPSRDARIRQSHRITRHLSPARLRARFAADPRNSRFANIIPPSPPPSSPRAHAPNLSRNPPPPSLPEVRASSPRSSPPSRAVCLPNTDPFSLSSTTRNTPPRRRPRPPFTTRRVAFDDTNFSRPSASPLPRGRATPRARSTTRCHHRGRSSARRAAVSRARSNSNTDLSKASRSVGHREREREKEREGLGDECGLKRCPRVTTARQSKRAVGVPRMSTARGDATRDDRRTATRARGCAREVEGTTGTVRGTSRVRRTRTNADERGRIPWFIHSFHSFIRRTHSSPLARRGDAV